MRVARMPHTRTVRGKEQVRIDIPKPLRSCFGINRHGKPMTALTRFVGSEREKAEAIAEFKGQIEDAKAKLAGIEPAVTSYVHIRNRQGDILGSTSLQIGPFQRWGAQQGKRFIGPIEVPADFDLFEHLRRTVKVSVPGAPVDYETIILPWRNRLGLDDTDKKVQQMRGRWRDFFAWAIKERGYPMGCHDMARITSDDLDVYKDHLFRRMNSGDPKEPIKTSKTVESHLRAITKLFKEAIEEQRNATLKAANPTKEFKVPKGKTDPRNKYQDFTRHEVRLILTKAADAPDEIKWPNRIAAYSGGREAEIVEAQTNDVEMTEEGTVIFHIRLDNRPPKQQIKNDFSARPVPIHQAVLDDGFLHYVARIKRDYYGGGDGPLFPQFKLWRDRLNTDASTRLMDWLRDEENGPGIKHPKRVFHSWRHVVKTRMREIDAQGRHYVDREDVADKLTGHANPSVGRDYGFFPIPVLQNAISRIPDWFATSS